MTATIEEVELDSRQARDRLAPRQRPYWQMLDEGGALGYFKGRESGVWIARFERHGARYAEQRIGLADDCTAADGLAVMSFGQARRAARNWCAAQAVEEARRPIDDSPFSTAGAPCNRD